MKAFSQFKIINHLDKIEQILRGEVPLPVTVEIDPTDQCNHNCPWCMDGHLRRGRPASLEPEVLLGLVDELGELGIGGVTVKGGGEPLVYPHIDRLLERLRAAGIESGVITNGELLAQHAQALTACCTWLRVSLGGATAATHQQIHRPDAPDALDRTLAGLELVAPRVFTGVVMVVGRANLGEMVETARLVKGLGARYIAFKQAVLPGRGQELDPGRLEQMGRAYQRAQAELADQDFQVLGSREYRFLEGDPPRPYGMCKAHHLIAIVCADGGLYACCSTRGRREFCFGSLYQQGFREIWYSQRRQKVLEAIDRGVCRGYCLGRTSFMRYDHYNEFIEYLASPDKPHWKFL